METLNLNVNLGNLTTEEREMLMKLVEKSQEKQSKVWKPKDFDIYYRISAFGEVTQENWCDNDDDKGAYEINNVFHTYEEAEEELTRRKILAKWKRLSIESGEEDNPWDNTNKHWSVCYNHLTKKLDSSTVLYNCKYEGVYFATRESLLEAIKELGEDNVKRYILGVRN